MQLIILLAELNIIYSATQNFIKIIGTTRFAPITYTRINYIRICIIIIFTNDFQKGSVRSGKLSINYNSKKKKRSTFGRSRRKSNKFSLSIDNSIENDLTNLYDTLLHGPINENETHTPRLRGKIALEKRKKMSSSSLE